MIDAKKVKIGDPILFINGYGVPTQDSNYNFRYGYVTAGFIIGMEYIKSRDSYLYNIGTINAFNRYQVVYKILGGHLIFDLNSSVDAELKLSQICEEPDFNDEE